MGLGFRTRGGLWAMNCLLCLAVGVLYNLLVFITAHDHEYTRLVLLAQEEVESVLALRPEDLTKT